VPQQENPEGKEQAAGSGQDPEKKAQVAAPGPENGKENTDEARVIPEAEKKAEPAATAVSADPAGTEKTENTGEADRAVSGLSDAAVLREEAGSGIRVLRLSQVDPNRSQPRQNFEDEALEELAESIRQFGVLQPILVQKKGSRYEIIAGERRWRASRKAGLKEIPAIVKEYSDQETLELSLIENIQRQDLNPIEEAKAFRRLLDEFGLRQEDLAVRVSKSRTAITNAVRLLKLDERVQDLLIRDQISMGHARALLPVEIPDEQFLLAQQIADKHLSVREVEKLVKTRLAGRAAKKAGDRKKTVEKDPALELAYRTIEEQLKQSLGTRAVIRGGGDGTGKIEIDFYSNEDLEKIVDLLT
jgi:ParB family chromosome partitioning protein